MQKKQKQKTQQKKQKKNTNIIWNIRDFWKVWEYFKKFWTTFDESFWNFIIFLFFSKTWEIYLDILENLNKFKQI